MIMSAGQAELVAAITTTSYSRIETLLYSDSIVQEVRTLCKKKLGLSPCLWQIRAAFAILKGDKDVICVARTGAGKSMTFYIPLVVRMEGIIIIIVPLNALATEMASQLSSMGFAALALTASTSSDKNFIVSGFFLARHLRGTHWIHRISHNSNIVLLSRIPKPCWKQMDGSKKS